MSTQPQHPAPESAVVKWLRVNGERILGVQLARHMLAHIDILTRERDELRSKLDAAKENAKHE